MNGPLPELLVDPDFSIIDLDHRQGILVFKLELFKNSY